MHQGARQSSLSQAPPGFAILLLPFLLLKRTRDQVADALEYQIGVERRRVDDDSIGRRHQRSRPAPAVARVAFIKILQDVLVYSGSALFAQLLDPADGTRLGAGGDIQLHIRLRAYDRADVASVEDRAARRR